MQIRVFSIPLPGGETINEEMNKWLRSKKVLQIKDHVVSNAEGTFWCYSVKYLDDATVGKKGRVDYREILDEETFKRFAAMREIRKRLADAEGIPAYTVFTNEELAALARLEVLTPDTMREVKGVGAKKIEKYGPHFFTRPASSA